MREKIKVVLVRAGYIMGGIYIPSIMVDMPVNPQEPWVRLLVLAAWLFSIVYLEVMINAAAKYMERK